MAEEESKAEDNQEEGEGKSSKKGIIIVAIIVLVAIAASVGVTLMLLGGDDSSTAEEVAEEVEVPKGPAVYHNLTPAFLITFNVGGRQRYMQVHVAVSSRDENVFTDLEHHMPLIRSKVINAYGGQDFDAIQTDAGKRALQELTLSVINGVLEAEGAGALENVFFTNFVLQ